MALSALMMLKTRHYLKEGVKIASMGYPDMIATPETIKAMLGDKKGLRYREDSPEICVRHGLVPRAIPDAESFFGLWGAKLDVFDIVQERGNEILCDLNYPCEIQEAYDLVLDVGTLEHCFNVAQAAVNMAGLLKKDGVIFHENPFNVGNHGFYGFNPTWYEDFYTENGFTVLDCRLCDKRSAWFPPRTGRFIHEGKEMGLFTMAQRKEVKEFQFPTQTKYKAKG